MSYTPNPTWQDYEIGNTLVTAAKMNHQESGILEASQRLDTIEGGGLTDVTLRTFLFGGTNRTQRVLFIAKNTTGYTQPADTDLAAQLNWTATKDTDSAFHPGATGSNTDATKLAYWTVPLTRRYDIDYHVSAAPASASDAYYLACKVTRNSPVVSTNSIASDALLLAPNFEGQLHARRSSYVLNQGETIFWSTYAAGGTINIGTTFGDVACEIVIRDAGPV